MIIDTTKLNHDLTPLCDLMIAYGSDKSGGWHNYTLVYDYLFKNDKNKVKNMFELGLGTTNVELPEYLRGYGASLKAWKQYFSKAQIYGADIDKNILFNEERIKTFYCDQTSPKSIKLLWENFTDVEFDIILEDGLHKYKANITFLENSLHKVKKSGFYIIEDIITKDLHLYYDYLSKTKLVFDECQLIELYNEGNKQDNNLLIIKK
jgi:hypothetical protein